MACEKHGFDLGTANRDDIIYSHGIDVIVIEYAHQTFSDFNDGAYVKSVMEAVYKSSEARMWVKVED